MSRCAPIVAVAVLSFAVCIERTGHAVPLTDGATTFDLGSGRVAVRSVTYPFRRPVQIQWTLRGVIAPPGQIVVAYTSAPHGRVFAIVESGVLFSDDSGASWSTGRVSGEFGRPLAISMSNDTFGAVVTAGNGVWCTSDGGQSWRRVREYENVALEDVAAVEPYVVYTDVTGGVRALNVGSGSITTLCDGATLQTRATLRMVGGSVVVERAGCEWVVGAGGVTRP